MLGTIPARTARRIGSVADDLQDGSAATRRDFLQRSAAAGAGVLALSIAGSNAALAHDADDDDVSDVDVLNFALTLEHLENAFYRDVGAQFDESDYMRADALEGFGNRVREDVKTNVRDIGAHEQAHVDELTKVVQSLGGDPVEEACYDFGVDDVDDFLAVAAVLENTGVSAYDGAIRLVEREELLTAGATIATVEARHASYLNVLVDDDPFPDAFDDTRTMDEVLSAAGGFIVECD